ncbi:hypothetical protein C427_2791 [Paraglaciecola psychrophila 170]|uniref:Uncharacterized protein n=1 Tax=Paraglaciecola psychrophila 170 TaxID=1129794 RepID=M4RMN6_9ALTE|nr:hypothetical protein C427_2791 [Paraglaciecola psychrophila 170]
MLFCVCVFYSLVSRPVVRNDILALLRLVILIAELKTDGVIKAIKY